MPIFKGFLLKALYYLNLNNSLQETNFLAIKIRFTVLWETMNRCNLQIFFILHVPFSLIFMRKPGFIGLLISAPLCTKL